MLEQGSVDLLEEAGVAGRLQREGLVRRRAPPRPPQRLDGRRVHVIYGQTEVVKDLISARLASGSPLLFEVDDVAVADVNTKRPTVSFRHGGRQHDLERDVIAGCDGFHGVCRGSVPPVVSSLLIRANTPLPGWGSWPPSLLPTTSWSTPTARGDLPY